MKKLTVYPARRVLLQLLIIMSLLASLACSRTDDQATSTKAEAPEVEVVKTTTIPLTTTSDAARSLYTEGQYLIDVGRVVQARAKFEAAVAADPDFALAYYGQSNAALSFAEFQHRLDSATEHAEGISEGERMLIEINTSFLSNDPAAGLAVARKLVQHYPDSARAWTTLAGMQTNQNDNEGARASEERALELEAAVP